MTKLLKPARVILGLALAAIVSTGGYGALVQAQDPPQPAPTPREKLLATRSCVDCDLSRVGFLKGDDLKAVNLSGATMVGTVLYSVDLTNANLGGADLSQAVLSFANLTNTNFGGANLTGANLAGATGASLTGATTTDTTVCPDRLAGPCR